MQLAGNAIINLTSRDKTAKGLKKTETRVNKTVSKLESKFSGLGTKVAAAFGGAMVLNALKNLASASLALGSDLNHTSKVLGITVEEMSALSDIARDVGTDFSAVEKAMQATTQQLENARSGSQKLADIFAELDIDIDTASVSDVNNQMLQLFNNTKSAEEQQKLLGQAQVIWGKKGADAFAKLATGATSVEDAIKKVEASGRLMTTATATALEKIDTQFGQMKQTIIVSFAEAFSGGFEGIDTTELNEKLSKLGDVLGEVTTKFLEFIKSPIAEFVVKIGGIIAAFNGLK
jgi:hypothetical protein